MSFVRDVGDMCAVVSALRDRGVDGLGDKALTHFIPLTGSKQLSSQSPWKLHRTTSSSSSSVRARHALGRLDRRQVRLNRRRLSLYVRFFGAPTSGEQRRGHGGGGSGGEESVRGMADMMLNIIGLPAKRARRAGDDALRGLLRRSKVGKADWGAVTRWWDAVGRGRDGVLALDPGANKVLSLSGRDASDVARPSVVAAAKAVDGEMSDRGGGDVIAVDGGGEKRGRRDGAMPKRSSESGTAGDSHEREAGVEMELEREERALEDAQRKVGGK